MDTLDRALLIADDLLRNSDYFKMKTECYTSNDWGYSAQFEKGQLDLE